MDIRNVQKSGSTYYLYLPAAWCRQNNLTTASKVALDATSEGDLVIKVHEREDKPVDLFLNLPAHDMRVVNKFIVASYLHPVKSFRIKLDKDITSLEILDQKRLLGGIEIVEFGGNQISCESSIFVNDPDVMLKTMVKKLANMLHVLIKEGRHELLDRYEEEIDRSNTLIVKAAVSALMFHRNARLRNIELYYIATLSKNLEWFADQLVHLHAHASLAKKSLALMNLLLKTLDHLDTVAATTFSKETLSLCTAISKADKAGTLDLLGTSANQLADTIVDWSITKAIDAST